MDFPVSTVRMRSPAFNAHAVGALQATALTDVRDHFAIEPDCSFMLGIMMV